MEQTAHGFEITSAARRKDREVVDWEMATVLRSKSPAERLQIGFALFRHATRFLTAHLGSEHPEWTAERLSREVAKRLSDGSW